MNNYLRDFEDEKVETIIMEDLSSCKKLLADKQNDFLIFHCNIRSLNKNINELKILLQGLGNNFKAIVLTETFFIQDVQLINLPGYNTFYNFGNLNSHDGIVIYLDCDIQKYFCNIIELEQIKLLHLNIGFMEKKLIYLECIDHLPHVHSPLIII